MKMFFYAILFSLLFMAGQASAYSDLKCVSAQSITYTVSNRVGGIKPFPGMVTNVEELIWGDDVAYRLVTRQSCEGHPDCVPQLPDLNDILPSGFSFEFYPQTKIVLSVEGPDHSTYHEIYAIQFRVNRMANIWMLCDYTQVMAP